MKNNTYTKEDIERVEQKLFALVFVNEKGSEVKPSKIEVEKMLALCKKRHKPSYYKLRHASGLGEEYTFKDVNMYSDDGQKMRRFESGFV